MRKAHSMEKQRNKHVLYSIRGAFPLVAGMLLFASCESRRFADILASADKIGELRYAPYSDPGTVYGEYWKEKMAAAQEDAENGYPSKWSYSGGRLAGTVTGMSIRRMDTSKYGPRLRACEDKWRPLLDRNNDIEKQRVKAIGSLRDAMFERKAELTDEKFSELCSNVVKRARLTPREVDLLLMGK